MLVRDVFRVRRVEGDIGMEIEAEGQRLPEPSRQHWLVTHDGSLRGEYPHQACEYVFPGPKTLEQTRTALKHLENLYKERNSKVNDSPRCGVHVHINCQSLTITQLYNFMTLYLVVENLLVRWCGPDREGNLFCLRAKDAEYLLLSLKSGLRDREFRRHFYSDNLRYASMNIKALADYGSLEFRSMRGTSDLSSVYKWASSLLHLRETAKEFNNPIDILVGMSAGGYENFIRHVCPQLCEELLSYPDWEEILLQGAREAQDVAYAGDWEELSRVPKRIVGGLEVDQVWEDDFPPIDF